MQMRAGAREGNIMRKIITGAVLIIICQTSLAEINTDNRSETVIVTATRTAITADENLSSVTVITHEDIERQNATSLQEVLQSVAGITMASSGGQGTISSLFMRGTNSDHVLVLVDGIKVGSITAGLTAFEFLPVEQIERIEIVRGPRSSLYGSEAIGGVIQIFTKKGDGKAKPSLSLSAGTYNTYKAVASVSGGDDRLNYNASLSSYDTKGFNACDGQPPFDGCGVIEPDNDSYRYVSGGLSLGYQLTDKTKLELSWLRSDGDVKYDGFYNQTKSTQEITGLKVSRDISSSWVTSFQLGQSKDERDNFSDGTFLNYSNTDRNSATLQNDFLLSDNKELTVGLDYQDDQLDDSFGYDNTSRANKGLFTQYIQGMGDQNIQASVRYDDNEQFGDHTTGSLAWGYKHNEKQRVTLSYGTAFIAPSFDDLYFPGFGNRYLRPEKSKSFEVGYRQQASWGGWSLNAYRTYIDDLIVYSFLSSLPENIEKAWIKGLEVTINARVSNWDAQLDLSLLDPENQSNNSNNGNVLPRRAKKLARLVISKDFGKTNVGGTLVAVGERYDDPANTKQLNSYYTLDINASYRLNPDWRVSASIKNVFDEDYETVDYYNNAGRNYLLTVFYQPAK